MVSLLAACNTTFLFLNHCIYLRISLIRYLILVLTSSLFYLAWYRVIRSSIYRFMLWWSLRCLELIYLVSCFLHNLLWHILINYGSLFGYLFHYVLCILFAKYMSSALLLFMWQSSLWFMFLFMPIILLINLPFRISIISVSVLGGRLQHFLNILR